jgi:virginiamycin B lyase
MRGRRWFALAALVLGALFVSGSATAVPPLRAKVRAPAHVLQGQTWKAVVTITRSGKRVGGLRVTLTVRRSGSARSTRARPVRRGVYEARLRFTAGGSWAWAVRVGSRRLARGSVTVRAPTPPPPPGPPPPPTCAAATQPDPRYREWCVARGAQVHPHDVWPAVDATVWYTGQFDATMGRLNPATGAFRTIALPPGAAPHGVIVGPDGAAWITDQGLNAIVRVDNATDVVTVFPIPVASSQPNTATFDLNGDLWFTGASGYYGKLDRPGNVVTVWPAPRGAGPYGIQTTPSGDVYYVSLRGPDDYLGKIDVASGSVTVIDTPGSGARRVWSDSAGRLWVTEYNSGHIARYDPSTGMWREWLLPTGSTSQPYAVAVDQSDVVWITSFGANALVRFDPATETFTSFPFPTPGAAVRQIVGAGGAVWGAESGTEKIVAFAP